MLRPKRIFALCTPLPIIRDVDRVVAPVDRLGLPPGVRDPDGNGDAEDHEEHRGEGEEDDRQKGMVLHGLPFFSNISRILRLRVS